jgi:hypothetical protein
MNALSIGALNTLTYLGQLDETTPTLPAVCAALGERSAIRHLGRLYDDGLIETVRVGDEDAVRLTERGQDAYLLRHAMLARIGKRKAGCKRRCPNATDAGIDMDTIGTIATDPARRLEAHEEQVALARRWQSYRLDEPWPLLIIGIDLQWPVPGQSRAPAGPDVPGRNGHHALNGHCYACEGINRRRRFCTCCDRPGYAGRIANEPPHRKPRPPHLRGGCG